jgi:hypothetical protein
VHGLVLFVDDYAQYVVSSLFDDACIKLDELIAVVDSNIENFYVEWYPYEDASDEYIHWFQMHVARLRYMRVNVTALRAQAELPATEDIALIHAQKHKFVTCVFYALEACLSAKPHGYVHEWQAVSNSDIDKNLDEQLRCLFGLHDFKRMLKKDLKNEYVCNARGETLELTGPFLFSSVKSFGVNNGWSLTSPVAVKLDSNAFEYLHYKKTLDAVEAMLCARYHVAVADITTSVCAGHACASVTQAEEIPYSYYLDQTVQVLRSAVTMKLGKFVGEMAQHIVLLERRLGVAGNALNGMSF